MRRSTLIVLAGVALAVWFGPGLSSAAGAAPKISRQAPCTPAPQKLWCTFLDDSSPNQITLRHWAFSVPGAGTAQVTFTGNTWCSSLRDGLAQVDLTTQIATTAGALADTTGPSGMRQSATLESGNQFPRSASFNLTTSRTLKYTSAGAHDVYFRVLGATQDPDVQCLMYDLAFSMVFVP